MESHVEVVGPSSLGAEEEREPDGASNSGESEGGDSADDLEVVIEGEEVKVEHLGVVFNSLDVSDLLAEGCVFFLDVVSVACDVCAVSAHIIIY